MKVYAIVYHDYEEHTTKYVCSDPGIANAISSELNRYLEALNPNCYRGIPTYMVQEFDVIDKYVEPEYPQYAVVGVAYNSEGKTDSERYVVYPPDSMNRCYFKGDTLPDWIKDVSVGVSSYLSHTGSEDNLIEFNLHVPMTKDDNADTIRSKAMQVINNTVDQLKAKGYELNKLLGCSISGLNPCIWDIRDYDDDLKVAIIHIPNPLMQDVKVE